MEFPRFNMSQGGMFDTVKNKLGLGDRDNYSNDEYDYDEFEEYGDSYDDSTSYGATRYGAHGSSPNLVSIEEVRASTRVPEVLMRDPLPARRVTSPSSSLSAHSAGASASASASASSASAGSGATTRMTSYGTVRQVERASDYLRSTATSDQPNESIRSEGLQSLFSSTAVDEPVGPRHARSLPASTASSSAARATAASAAGQGAYDPFEAYAGAGVSSHNPTRSLVVLKPMNYGEVERIAKAVKAGDAVVLALRTTPEQLAKRVLDFSFGVASALDAGVECIADKVFVITRGRGVSDAERVSLRSKGIL